jgi:hypothetical protein
MSSPSDKLTMVNLSRFFILCLAFFLESTFAANECGKIGNISERVEDCKTKNISDEKYQNYLKQGFYVYSINVKNEYFFTDNTFKWGYSEAYSYKHECAKPYRKLKKSYYKQLSKRGIQTDKGYHRCAMRVDKFMLFFPSRKERFQ